MAVAAIRCLRSLTPQVPTALLDQGLRDSSRHGRHFLVFRAVNLSLGSIMFHPKPDSDCGLQHGKKRHGLQVASATVEHQAVELPCPGEQRPGSPCGDTWSNWVILVHKV